ncbi:DMT family transporter [Vibrio plantisponsor]|uniref:DMT family transporter n=1 Tax=Vibrio plantisponsor TaxID=664643 RepID=A0ABU4IH89_9VIBR|nr:DMT family transporter [Vibrio plantisponsor]MDW6017524.1 DMT family transporter [Vibrio plantisponsor]NNM40360.1 DMT family transporter [Vibrio plantisponsor]
MTILAAIGARFSAFYTDQLKGIIWGISAASIGALYTVAGRLAFDSGMNVTDLMMLRYLGAMFILLPLHGRRFWQTKHLITSNLRSWLLASILAGPLFAITLFLGLQSSSPANSAMLPFIAMSTMGIVWSALLLKFKIRLLQWSGLMIIIAGLVLSNVTSLVTGADFSWQGLGLFWLAGSLWAGFGVFLKVFKLPALTVTTFVSVISSLVVLPIFLLNTNISYLVELPLGLWLSQLIIQGVLAGCGTTHLKKIQRE